MLGHRVDYADLYFQYSRAEGWSLEEGIVKSGSFNIDQGVGVRAVSGEKTAFAYSDDISLAALDSGGTRPRARSPRQGGAAERCRCCSTARRRRRCTCRTIRSPASRMRKRCALLERLERYARALDPRVVQVMAGLAGEYEVVLVARSDGLLAADVRPLVRLSLTVIVERTAGASRARPAAAGVSTTPISTTRCCEDYAAQAVHQAVRQSRRRGRRRRAT